MGYGPMTGRAAGYCAGYSMPGFANPVGGRGFGRGWGMGRGGGWGRRNMYYATGLTGWQRAAAYPPPAYAPPTKEQEVDGLKAQASGFQEALDDIRKRIAEIEAE